MSLFTDLSPANQVQALYIAYYGRPADFDGQNFWVDQIAKKGLANAINSFGNSAESQALFGTTVNSGTVDKIYQAVLGRAADPEGLNFYANQVNTGKLTLAEVALAVLDGVKGNDVGVINNRITAANNFTSLFNDGTNDAGQRASYTGQAAADAGRAFIAAVTADVATGTPAAAATAVNGLAPAQNVGQTFTLTTGADTIPGTANDDIINALTVNATGAAATTLSDFDVIDGGTGNDTLNIYVNAQNNALPVTASIKNVETVNLFSTVATAAALTDASKYVGVTALNQIGAQPATAVTNLAATTTAGYNGTTGGISVTSAATAASAAIALTNVAEGQTITVLGGATGVLNSVKVSGTVADTNTNGVIEPATIAATVGKDVESLAVNTAIAATLIVADGAGTKTVSTVDASASTGAVTFVGAATVANIKTGSANDTVTLATSLNATVKAASVSTGAGNDTVAISAVVGTAAAGQSVTADTGAGNDTVTVTIAAGVAYNVTAGAGDDVVVLGSGIKTTDIINGGDGTDTISVAGKAARIADDYIVFNKVLQNFEAIKFSSAEGLVATQLNASLLGANYATLDFFNGSFVDNVSTQALVANGALTAETVGYKSAAESLAAGGANAITYAGVLNITQKLSTAAQFVQGHAETVNLTVQGATANAPAAVETNLSGEMKTANIVLSAGTDTKGTVATADDTFVASKVIFGAGAGVDTLADLTSVTLSGNGVVDITNTATSNLVNIDASALNSVDIKGVATAGLKLVTTSTKAEMISLGGGLDDVSTSGSTYSVGLTNMDTIVGLNLVVTAGAIDYTKGDKLSITGFNDLGATGKFVTTQTDLDLALLDAAKFKVAGADVDTVAFQMGGNTYLYQDNGGDNLVGTNDFLVKLVGNIDLDALVLAV